MQLRERRPEERPTRTAPAGTPDNLDSLRATAARLLAAGDIAIERALSQSSETFLRATRQTGGE